MPTDDKMARMMEIVKVLGLEKCMNTSELSRISTHYFILFDGNSVNIYRLSLAAVIIFLNLVGELDIRYYTIL